MPWVRFTRNFNWRVPDTGGRITIAYTPRVLLVTRACAEAAIAAGAAEKARRPPHKPTKELSPLVEEPDDA